jgi:hypothetical protein
MEIFGCPKWLELPWSDPKDFVEAPDGRLYLSLGFYRSVLCYDRAGKFVASYTVPSAKHEVQLAVDDQNHVYYWAVGKIFVKSQDWQDIDQVEAPKTGCRLWTLDPERRPVCSASSPDSAKGESPFAGLPMIPSRPLTVGDPLFATPYVERLVFFSSDGGTLERNGDTIVRRSRDGVVIRTYGTPWYLWWARFPLPGFFAWPVFFIWAVLSSQFRRDRERHKETGSQTPTA